jgi:hypothetical protein
MQLSEIWSTRSDGATFVNRRPSNYPEAPRAVVSACVEPITRYLTAAVEAVRQSAINNHQETI